MECPLWMFIKASDVRRFVVIDERSQMFNLRIVENVRSHSADVTGSVHAIFKSMYKFGYLCLSHSLIDCAKEVGLSLSPKA